MTQTPLCLIPPSKSTLLSWAAKGEESAETIIAAKGGNKDEIIYETADLWFHTLVMLIDQGIEPQAVLDELARRFGTSGIEEKASRTKK